MVPVDDDYLIQIGRLAYSVTYLEGLVLYDLPHLAGLPAELELKGLAGRTTGQLGAILQKREILEQVADTSVRTWLQRSGELLSAAAKIRNSVLHARPATIQGQQMLQRWHPEAGQVFPIEGSWLSAAQKQVEGAIRELAQTRPAGA
ncbi:hypothetical protein OG765_27835 [Streptomyces sp. NBC_00555]|uniref:hypothetical protein n=1 Tax=Streptomyces sp. NBC_00555 TaxID=2903662 RepID=UPI00224DB783|nr:hypothetical protein [Streptomyces sp. NBC_00555]MCX5014772.1 hypothetical protein [Streptomyces sp. NBC_00555]